MVDGSHPLLFMHIPRTGGMSLFTAFCARFGKRIGDLYDVSPLDAQEAARLIRAPNLSIYCGHFCFGLHEWFDRPTCYASVVRHPVERMISLYYYLNVYRRRIRRLAREKKVTPAELFGDGSVPDYYADFLPWLEGENRLETFLACPSAELENGMVRRFSGVGLAVGPCVADALERAQEVIETCFSIVGVFERFACTLERFKKTFGWPWLEAQPVNARPRLQPDVPAVTEKDKARIAEMNRLDMALYEWVMHRFDHRVRPGRTPVFVPGGKRSDFAQVPLWKAVGVSPWRKAAMQSGGPPAETIRGEKQVTPRCQRRRMKRRTRAERRLHTERSSHD